MNELSAVIRFIHLTASVLLVGSFSFTLCIARPACRRAAGAVDSYFFKFLRLQLRLDGWHIAIIFVTALLWLWLQSLNVIEPSSAALFNLSAALPLLTETRFGKVWLGRMFLLIVIAGLVWFKARQKTDTNSLISITAGFGLSACLLASLALSGHAAAAEGSAFAIQASADGLHLLASGVWLGGLVPLGLLLRALNHEGSATALTIARETTRRFSAVALASVGVMVVTGSYNAWILVGGPGALFGTPYGKLLLIKLGFLSLLLGVAAVNLLRLKPKITAGPQARPEQAALRIRQLTRNLVLEAVLGMVILLIVGHMGVTPPARHVQPEWPFSFRWDWSALENGPLGRAAVERSVVWAAVGAIAFVSALARRRRRILAATIGFAALGYASHIMHTAVSIDAYPTTYRRPAVAYHAISVANGKIFYQDSGCIVCHGPYGYGDGPAAQELSPKPADLTAPHANRHTAGDLFWWLSYGVQQSSAMPGYGQSLSAEERWDLINFLRALSSGEQARNLASIIEDEPWLVAPDFTYGTNLGNVGTLKDHRGGNIVLLVFCSLPDSLERLQQLKLSYPGLRAAGVELLLVPTEIRDFASKSGPVELGLTAVTEGGREIFATYALFTRSFADDKLISELTHVEFLIDKQGYIRARWLPTEGEGWRKIDVLMRQIELLQKEKPRAPAPDEHVH